MVLCAEYSYSILYLKHTSNGTGSYISWSWLLASCVLAQRACLAALGAGGPLLPHAKVRDAGLAVLGCC